MQNLTMDQVQLVSGGLLDPWVGAFETVMKYTSVGVAGAVVTVATGGNIFAGIVAGGIVDAADNAAIAEVNSL